MSRVTIVLLGVIGSVGLARAAEPMPGPFPFAISQYDYGDWQNRPDQFAVVDRGGRDGTGPYAGQPDTVWLDDGTQNGLILIGFPRGHGHPNTYLRMSADGGRTWSDRLPTPGSFHSADDPQDGKGNYAPVIDLLCGPHKEQYLNVIHVYHEDEARRMARQAIMKKQPGMTWSQMLLAGDRHWTEFRPLWEPDPGSVGGAPPKTAVPIRGPAGKPIPGHYARMYHSMQGRLWQISTIDGGLSWTQPEVVSRFPDFPGAYPCEPEVIRSPDGKQLVCICRENHREYEMLYMTSEDEGRTWSKMREAAPSLTGDRHVARYTPDGRLIITFRDRSREANRTKHQTYGDFVAWVGTYDDIGGGREGRYRVRLLDQLPPSEADCGYAGLERLPDGTFLSTTYANWTDDGKKNNDVVAMRFTTGQLDRLAGLTAK